MKGESSWFLLRLVINRILQDLLLLNLPGLNEKAILFEYNVQHDCHQAGCAASGKWAVLQEHVESGITEMFIEHKPSDIFLINTHAFHNAHLIRAILPW
jgi:hypothetical protein